MFTQGLTKVASIADIPGGYNTVLQSFTLHDTVTCSVGADLPVRSGSATSSRLMWQVRMNNVLSSLVVEP